MNKNRGLTPLAVVLMLSGSLALTGCDDKPAQQGAQQMPEVGIVTLKSAPLQITTELPGRTSAYRVAEVRPQVSGIILKRNFTEGSDIQAGVSLYQIDPATYQATYESAKGDLAKAQAAANMDQLTVKRYQKLLGTKYISHQDYDTAVATAPPWLPPKQRLKPRALIWPTPKSPRQSQAALVNPRSRKVLWCKMAKPPPWRPCNSWILSTLT